MPARIDHPAVREQVRLLYIANGNNLTQAAKTVGIPIDRAEKWKERGKWDKLNDAAAQQITVSESVGRTADNLASELKQQSQSTKLNLSQATHKASKVFARVKGSTVIRQSEHLRRIVSSAAQIHGWEGQQQSSNLDINVLAGGRAMIQVVQKGGAEQE